LLKLQRKVCFQHFPYYSNFSFIFLFLAPVSAKKAKKESSSEEESSEDETPATTKPLKKSKLFIFLLSWILFLTYSIYCISAVTKPVVAKEESEEESDDDEEEEEEEEAVSKTPNSQVKFHDVV